MIPKITSPLAKFIRTGEGILVFLFGTAATVVPIITNSLTPAESLKWGGIVTGVALVSRTGLKAVALLAQQTGIQPAQLNTGAVTLDLTAVLKSLLTQIPKDASGKIDPDVIIAQIENDAPEIERLVTDAVEFAHDPQGNTGNAAIGNAAAGSIYAGGSLHLVDHPEGPHDGR